jgi:hypothetical protein
MSNKAIANAIIKSINESEDGLKYGANCVKWPADWSMSLINLTSTEAWMLHDFMQQSKPWVKIRDYKPGKAFLTGEVDMHDQIYFLGVMKGGETSKRLDLFHIKKPIEGDNEPEL